MTLHEVQSSWANYPKGLEDAATTEDDSSPSDTDPESEQVPSGSHLTAPRNPALARLSNSRNSSSSSSSSSSTPASSSSTSLSPSTSASTPNSSTSYVPIGLHPRQTSQRHNNLTSSPLFVTWNTVSGSSSSARSLRGCIGTFESLPLSSGLSSYALTSALQDHRFSPITLRELPTLEVSVTLLTDFETAKDALDWELGVHGIRISFYARNRRYGACYLPDVAVEQGWDREETVVSLMRKAGWGGRKEKWADVGELKVTRFQGKCESVGYEEWRAWKEWAGKEEGKMEG